MGEKLEASTQYNDWTGGSALDFSMGGYGNLKNMCQIPEDYFLIGVDIYFGEKEFLIIDAIACNSSKYGSCMDDVMTNSEIKAERFRFKGDFKDFLKLTKRFNVAMRSKNLKACDIEYSVD